jgi:Polyketide cyclase / dehydrase and lipid transport
MLRFLLVVLAILIAGVLLFAASRPGAFRVERKVRIKGSPADIFPQIDDLHLQNVWSPWAHKDPAMRKTYSGAASGRGAIYAWEGNKEIGRGRMEILESVPSTKAVMSLEFIKPFAAHHTVEFSLAPSDDATLVTWAIYGPRPFSAKVMHLFFNVDTMIGKEFETGLANLKALIESGPKKLLDQT